MSELASPPRISVIIPTWNRGATIRRAIESALAQTLPPCEVLVCDDGSTDDTEEIVHSTNDPRVRWLPGSRGGRPAIPRNRGIDAAKGEWLAFLDSDDEWLPDKLERQFAQIVARGVRAGCSDAWRLVPNSPVGEQRLLGGKDTLFTFYELARDNRVVCSSAILHRSLFADTGGFPEGPELTVGEDYALWLKVLTLTDFAYVGMPLVVYRDDPANSIRAEGKGQRSQRVAVFEHVSQWAAAKRGLVPDHFRRTACRALWSARMGDPMNSLPCRAVRRVLRCRRAS